MSEISDVKIDVATGQQVSALLLHPASARAAMLLAHGAGAGMTHPFMESVATGLSERKVATLRYQFPYMERGSRRPDSPGVAQATVEATAAKARQLLPSLPLFAAGKSFGGRMTSRAQAESPLPGVRGLVFFGFPLHAPGKPSDVRGDHLSVVKVPMLFLQGTRDEFAEPAFLNPLLKRLGRRATLVSLDEANHAFHVPKRSGRTDAQVLDEMLDAAAGWLEAHRP